VPVFLSALHGAAAHSSHDSRQRRPEQPLVAARTPALDQSTNSSERRTAPRARAPSTPSIPRP